MNRQLTVLISIVVFMILIATPTFAGGQSEAGSGGATAVNTVTLRLGHTDPPGGILDETTQLFAEKVFEYTEGRYEVDLFPGGQLGDNRKLLELEQLGALDFVVTGAAIYGRIYEPMSLTLCPFLLETLEQGWHLYDDSDWVQQRFAELEDEGFKMLATWEAGFRCLTTKTPVISPEDVAGMKLRVPGNPIHLAIWNSLGANPVGMGITEVYMAIQQDVVDGQENPIQTIHVQKFFEVAPYIAITNHVYGPTPISMSMNTWETLAPEDQEAIQRAATECAAYMRQRVSDSINELIADMESEGATVVYPDLDEWREASMAAYDPIKELFGAELVESLIAEAAEIRAAYPAE